MNYISVWNLRVAATLHAFIEDELLPASGIKSPEFWTGLADTVSKYGPKNATLLAYRDMLQSQIDEYHREHFPLDAGDYKAFLQRIGYLLPEPNDFQLTGTNIDDEIARISGPQLVVPLSNARYAINAANARWGSLYDALYGTDALLPPDRRRKEYDTKRGSHVIAHAKKWLDDCVSLEGAFYRDAMGFFIANGSLIAETTRGPKRLKIPSQFAGYQGAAANPTSILLKQNGLHIEIVIDRHHFVGREDRAGIADILLESAITTIMDMEDSVAATDAADKVLVYRNLLGLIRGTLTAQFERDDHPVERTLAPDRVYTAPKGELIRLPGRSLMLVRNVGLHMYTDALRHDTGARIPEGLLDLFVTAAIARVDLLQDHSRRNSRSGSTYVVKPKLHGADEVAFVVDTFGQAEKCLDIPPGTLKIGIMDEERRTSVNLMACIDAAKDRVFFINTGFLDRTGDEIHTAMEAGAVLRKNEMKSAHWLKAYEKSNVEVGLRVGLPGRGQIGKGMWAMPDKMADMLAQKNAQLWAGASTAWVPSPTAATLHALHYHMVDVRARQRDLAGSRRSDVDEMLVLALMTGSYSKEEIELEVENNLQSILGYVVRWVDQGIGCSKVPDLNNIALMEDRATLRISSQHVANWLRHGVVTEATVLERLRRMAAVVDLQNRHDPGYRNMAPEFDGPAFRTAQDLIMNGAQQPNGYTEFVLHGGRQEARRRGRA